MGCIFSKPLTLADLDTALTPIRNDLALLKDSLLAPDGNEIARDVTVAVHSEGGETVSCHGCLMRRGSDIFLVSAAHAIVDLTCGTGTYSIKNKSSLLQPVELSNKVRFDRIYIPAEYVQDGSKDVGIARVEGHQLAENLPEGCQWLQVSVGGEELVGKTVVGHGRVFLRGTVLSYPNENRFMIGTPSISGCSGCPLFDSDKHLAAFVHGGVRHRGGLVLHGHNGGTDNATGYLYADGIGMKGSTFLKVDPEFYKVLQNAECIEDALASQPADAAAYTNHAPEELRKMVPEASTLEELMKALSHKIWSGNVEEGDKITTGPQLELLSRHR